MMRFFSMGVNIHGTMYDIMLVKCSTLYTLYIECIDFFYLVIVIVIFRPIFKNVLTQSDIREQYC